VAGRPTVVAGSDLAVLAAVGGQVRADGPMIAVGPAGPGAAPGGFAAAVPAAGGWDAAAAQVVAGWGAPRVLITCPAPVPRRQLAPEVKQSSASRGRGRGAHDRYEH